jgi:hypothetical protein
MARIDGKKIPSGKGQNLELTQQSTPKWEKGKAYPRFAEVAYNGDLYRWFGKDGATSNDFQAELAAGLWVKYSTGGGGGGGGPVTIPSTPVASFVYRPGGTAGDNVYTDFNKLFDDYRVVEGYKVIELDGSLNGNVVALPPSQYGSLGLHNLDPYTRVIGVSDGSASAEGRVLVQISGGGADLKGNKYLEIENIEFNVPSFFRVVFTNDTDAEHILILRNVHVREGDISAELQQDAPISLTVVTFGNNIFDSSGGTAAFSVKKLNPGFSSSGTINILNYGITTIGQDSLGGFAGDTYNLYYISPQMNVGTQSAAVTINEFGPIRERDFTNGLPVQGDPPRLLADAAAPAGMHFAIEEAQPGLGVYGIMSKLEISSNENYFWGIVPDPPGNPYYAGGGWGNNSTGSSTIIVLYEDFISLITQDGSDGIFVEIEKNAATDYSYSIRRNIGGTTDVAWAQDFNRQYENRGKAVAHENATNGSNPNTLAADAPYITYCKTSGGVVTVTLPASPVDGEYRIIKDADSNANTNNITIDPNGNSVEGGSPNLTLTTDGAGVALHYNDSEGTWYQIPSL